MRSQLGKQVLTPVIGLGAGDSLVVLLGLLALHGPRSLPRTGVPSEGAVGHMAMGPRGTPVRVLECRTMAPS